jgi:hypothetical protein
MPVQPSYRCHCGKRVSATPSQGIHDVCENCGSVVSASHVGSSPSAQASPAMAASVTLLQSSPLKAAPVVPTGNPNSPKITKTVLSNGKVSVVTIDALSGKIINDTRNG